MQNKNYQHHVTIHQKIERLCHERTVLAAILACMIVGVMKYEPHVMGIMQSVYHEGFGLTGSYTNHQEITRMPVQYGSNMRHAPISGE